MLFVSTLTISHVHLIALAKSAEPQMLSFAKSLKSNNTFIKFLCISAEKV